MLSINPSQRLQFGEGGLRRQWFERYPQLFDQEDFAKANKKPPRGKALTANCEMLLSVRLRCFTDYYRPLAAQAYSLRPRRSLFAIQ